MKKEIPICVVPNCSLRRIRNLIPKGATLLTYKVAKETIDIGPNSFVAYEFTYLHNGQEFRSKIKGFKL